VLVLKFDETGTLREFFAKEHRFSPPYWNVTPGPPVPFELKPVVPGWVPGPIRKSSS
jgi:hypothetical protein